MVSLQDTIEKTLSDLTDHDNEIITEVVSDVLHRLPQMSIMSDEHKAALDAGDNERCVKAETTDFPAFLAAMRRVTASDPCIIVPLAKLFGIKNIDLSIQAIAFGTLFTFECMLEYLRKNKSTDEVAQLNRLFTLDSAIDSSDNEDMEAA